MAIGILRPHVLSLVLIALAGSSAAQSTKLNAPLAREVFGDVEQFRVRPDGSLAVFATDDERGFGQLSSVALKGAPQPLSIASVTQARRGFELTADGQRLVYQDRDLFSVLVDGSAEPVRLHEPTVVLWQLEDFRMAAGGRVVFQGRFPNTSLSRLHSAPADGSGTRVPLGGPAVATNGTFEVSPDGESAVWIARDGSGLFLWSAPTDGSGPAVQLTEAPLAARSPLDFAIAPDSSRVAFRHASLTAEDFALYAVPIDGSAPPVELSDALVAGGDVQQGFAFTPDGLHLVYRADRDENDAIELFSVPADGHEAPVEISGSLVEDGDVRSFQATPDGQRVLYLADQEVDERPWLYVAPVDGSAAPVRIGGALSTAQALDFEIHPASTSVVFRTREGIEPPALLVANLSGGPALELSVGWVPAGYALSLDGRWVVFNGDGLFARPIDASRPAVRLHHSGSNFAFLPGGRTVVFLTSVAGQRVHELYRVSLGGTGLVKLSGELATGEVFGDVSSFLLDDSGKQLVYDVEGSTLDTPIVGDEAFVLDLRPQQAPLALFPGDTGETDIFQYSVSPDRSRLVYSAGNDPAETSDLFSIRLDGVTPGVRFTEQEGWSGIGRFVTTPDSRSVVYLRWQGTDQITHLYHVDIDRVSDPVELNGPLVEGGEVHDFRLGPDGSRVVYLADEHEVGSLELFRRELTGGGPMPLIADPPLHPWSASGLELTADGKTVLFNADLLSDDVRELYAMPSDGRSGPVKLSPAPLVATGDVTSRALVSPDGQRIVFQGDLETEGALELWSAPIDGSAPAVKVSGTMVAGGGTFSYPHRFTPDGARVVFQVDRETDEVRELYSAPSDGSAPPVKLSGAMVTGGDVLEFAIAPDAMHVAFIADRLTDEVFELFVSAVDGSAAPVRLSGTLVAGGDVDSRMLEISPDGVWVAFIADGVTDGVGELFVAPLDGSAEPIRRNGPLVAGGDVYTQSFLPAVRFSPQSDRVLYVADQDVDDVHELYASPLPKLRAAPRGVARGR